MSVTVGSDCVMEENTWFVHGKEREREEDRWGKREECREKWGGLERRER